MLTVLFVVLGTFFVAVTLRTAETFLALKKVPPTPAIEPVDTSCRLWEVRHTQLKMLDAGIITDEEMSICDNENCRDCATTKKSLRLTEETNRRLSAIQSQNEYRRQKQLERRYFQVGDDNIPMPDSVPNYAHLDILSDGTGYVRIAHWTWLDPDSGKRMAVKSVILNDSTFKSTEPFTRSNVERAKRRAQKRAQLGYM